MIVTNPKTYDNIEKWNKDVNKYNDEDIPRIIVGNKHELKDNDEIYSKYNGIKHIEEVFEMLVKDIKNFSK